VSGTVPLSPKSGGTGTPRTRVNYAYGLIAGFFYVQIGEESESSKPAIWIDAGIHAREWIAPATAVYIIHAVYMISDSQSPF